MSPGQGEEPYLCGVAFSKFMPRSGSWSKTGIPLKSDESIKNMVKRSLEEWQSMNKLKSRYTKPDIKGHTLEKVSEFKEKEKSSFLVTHRDAEELIKKDRMRDEKTKEEDILFLISMKGDRKAQVGKPDGDYEKSVAAKRKRIEGQARMKEALIQPGTSKDDVNDGYEEVSSEEGVKDDNFEVSDSEWKNRIIKRRRKL